MSSASRITGEEDQVNKKHHATLLGLPAELRNYIYSLVYSPGACLVLRRHGGKEIISTNRHILQPTFEFGRFDWTKSQPTKWETSLSGLILVNKQLYHEAMESLYGQTHFEFPTISLCQEFMTIIPSSKLTLIKSVTVQREPRAVCRPADRPTREASWRNMLEQLTQSLPNIEELGIKTTIDNHLGNVLHSFISSYAEVPGAVDLEAAPWIQPLKTLRALEHLSQVTIKFDIPREGRLENYFRLFEWLSSVITILGRTRNEAEAAAASQWAKWNLRLYESIGQAGSRMIMKKEKPWKDYVEILQQYRRWALEVEGKTE